MEWMQREAEKCRDCRNPLEESAGDGPDAMEYEPVDYVCFACQAADARRAQIDEDEPSSRHGRKVAARTVGPLPRKEVD